jgi:hypothetical protein
MMSDKVQIFCSPLGMYSLFRGDYIISVLRDDGSLDEKRLTAMVQYIANLGVNAMRDFYWIDSKSAYEKISPFWYRSGDLGFNHAYFENQRRIAVICKAHGVRYYLSLFDHCGTKGYAKSWNPWRYFNDFFYGEDARSARHQYIKILLDVMYGLDYGIEICNEPKPGQGEFLADTFLNVFLKGLDPAKIILGLDYFLKESKPAYGNDFRNFNTIVCEELGADWDRGLMLSCLFPVHNTTMERIRELWGPGPGPGDDRRILYSTDGVMPRPNRGIMNKLSTFLLETKARAREKDRVHFEVVLGKQNEDPLDAVTGVAEAYKDIFGTYPANYGKYPDAVFPVEFSVGVEGAEPEKRSIEERVDQLESRVLELETQIKSLER